jgi:hypothetical protein
MNHGSAEVWYACCSSMADASHGAILALVEMPEAEDFSHVYARYKNKFIIRGWRFVLSSGAN